MNVFAYVPECLEYCDQGSSHGWVIALGIAGALLVAGWLWAKSQ